MCFSGVLVAENIINTLYKGAVLLQNGCLFMFLSTNNQHKMFVIPISGNKQTTSKLLSHVGQFRHVYCLHI